ncbi:MAG: helix-turn-helix transcriptional regulator [Saprospiraceae bacterium]|nr:helix-turn-helix transcriptional regulator [Saprospiraceae bacterium]
MLFYFNQWSSLLLPFFLQGIIFTALLMWRGWREERLSDKLLAALVLIFTLRVANWMLGFAHWYDAHDWHSTFMFYFPFNHWFLIGPLVYFYFRSLTNRDFRFRKKDLRHFIPATIDLAIILFVFIGDVVVHHWLRGEPLPYHFGTQGRLRMEGIPGVDEALIIGTIISLSAYFVITIRLYRRYRNFYVNEHFSDTEKVSFTWLRNFLYVVAAAILIWFVFFVINFFADAPNYRQDWYSFFAWGIVLYYLSISGYYTRPEASLYLQFEPEEKKEKVEESFDNELKNRILKAMQDEQLYLHPELTLNDLAKVLNISPALLSKIINTDCNKNFNDFINEYRVEAVKKKLQNPDYQHLSLLGIAFECGFNSKATFNRAFRKHAGLSPSEFMATQKMKPVSN